MSAAPKTEVRPAPTRVIVTKVRPPKRRRDLLTRERLNAYISDNLERKLLLVSAPAGYGKTSLLVDYAHASGLPVCWYRLDPYDSDPVVFFEHLVEAVRQTFPGTCPRTLELLRTQGGDGKLDLTDVVGSLVNEIDEAVSQFFLLVLDDYQNVDDADEVNRALDTLLHYLPDACQLVIAGRSVPRKLTLTRLAGAGQVVGVGQEQLRFTAAEIGQLVSSQDGRQLSEMECERLARESEGWITAIVLGGQRLLDGVRGAVPDRERLFAFLAEEVLGRQPADVQSFLVRSATLEELSPALCDAVLERSDSEAMLDWLEAHSLFLTRTEGEGDWRRYHQLFHDFLRSRLGGDGSADTSRLHLRAAEWFGAAHRPEDEIHHLLAAGSLETAAERMADAVEDAHAHGRWQTIVRWADALPEAVLRKHPVLVQRLGTALTYSGDLPRALQAYNWAVEHYQDVGDDQGLASVLVRRAVVHRRMGNLQMALEDGTEALESAGDDWAVAGMAHRALGGTHAATGDMDAAAHAIRQALACFETGGQGPLVASACNDLSAILNWSGQAAAAVEYASAAVDGWERAGNLGSLALALNNLGSAQLQCGLLTEARGTLQDAAEVGRRSGYRRAEAHAVTTMGEVMQSLGNLEAARGYLTRGIALAEGAGDAGLVACGLALRADVERLEGRLERSNADVDEAGRLAERIGSANEIALVALVRGANALAQGRPDVAVGQLQRAAELFARIGARRDAVRALTSLAMAEEELGDESAATNARARADELLKVQGAGAVTSPAPPSVPPGGRRPVGVRRAASAAGPHTESVPRPEHASALLRVRAFGEPEVVVGGRRVTRTEWQSATARSMFFYLLGRPEGSTRDELMAEFWPDSDFVRARSSLHSALYRIRRAIGVRDVVQTDFERYFVRWPGQMSYDVDIFEAQLAEARAASDATQLIAALQGAVEVARGSYLEGLAEDWCTRRRRTFEDELAKTLLELAEAHRGQGHWREAVGAYQRLLTMDGAHEDAHRGLMQAYAAAGDRTRALRQFDVCKAALAAELGVQPAQETLDLYERIAAARRDS